MHLSLRAIPELAVGLFLCISFAACAGSGDEGNSGLQDAGVDGGAGTDGGSLTKLTWYRDALPVVQKRCQGCHVEGGIAPFSLETYAGALAKADNISWAVETGLMPPWTPDESCQPLAHSRALSAAERDTLIAWVSDGALEGDPADAPGMVPPPVGLPRIDLEADAGVDYLPSGNLDDDYHCSIVNPRLMQDEHIIGVEVVPGTPSQVHHVILFAAQEAQALARDAQESAPGWTCFGGPGAGNGDTLAGWAPGTPATLFPAGTGIPLLAGQVLIMQVHYHPAAVPKPDRTRVRLVFADGPVTTARMLPVVDASFAIPPGAVGYSTTSNYGPSPVAATVWGVFPHMHVLGQKIRAWVSGPNKADTCLVDIPEWSFDWQQLYFFENSGGLPIEAGDSLNVSCTWDNPGQATVRWGEGTLDEMCLVFVYYTL